ncbi:MAG TPA: hypothetical protein VN018_07020 [Brevundimonas sp.]|nr:hypothetical protein [Brevundimonas sp.]
MSRYTRLERAVMEALIHDLRSEIPDLAGQFEESRPSQRRNSGFGLFTEMIVDRSRPAPATGPTGDLGTVHVMVGHLPDPIAFRARVRHGVLLGVIGDSYGQDTRAIDFATVAFDQVFTVNAQGQSIPFEPARQMPPSPLLDLHRHNDRDPIAPVEPPPLVNVGALQRVQEVDAPSRPLPAAFPTSGSTPEPRVPTDQMSLLIGLWALVGVIALLLVFVFRLPFAVAVFFAIFAGRAVKQPKVLSAVRKIVDNWQTSQATGPN